MEIATVVTIVVIVTTMATLNAARALKKRCATEIVVESKNLELFQQEHRLNEAGGKWWKEYVKKLNMFDVKSINVVGWMEWNVTKSKKRKKRENRWPTLFRYGSRFECWKTKNARMKNEYVFMYEWHRYQHHCCHHSPPLPPRASSLSSFIQFFTSTILSGFTLLVLFMLSFSHTVSVKWRPSVHRTSTMIFDAGPFSNHPKNGQLNWVCWIS